MNAIIDQPDNKNFLTQHRFQLSLNRAPTVKYFCTAATLPGVTLDPVEIANPVGWVPYPGTKVIFTEFSVRFRVDEDLVNYQEILNWFFSAGAPETTDQYKAAVPTGRVHAQTSALYSDARLLVFSSHLNHTFSVHIKDAFPISVSPLEFNTSSADVEYLEADVSFRYTTFSIDTS